MEEKKVLTMNQGVPVSDIRIRETVGERGPMLLQDVRFIEKMVHFDRERTLQQVVHAKGAGAHGVTNADPEFGRLVARGLKL